jgi:hypothetical protein
MGILNSSRRLIATWMIAMGPPRPPKSQTIAAADAFPLRARRQLGLPLIALSFIIHPDRVEASSISEI